MPERLRDYLFLLLALGIASHGWAQQTYTFAPQSRMWVEGTSSLHDWKCNVRSFRGTVELISADFLFQLQQVRVKVPVEEMGCGNKTMNKKMRKALKAEEHPVITFQMTRHLQNVSLADTALKVVLEGDLQIAGVTHTVDIEAIGKALQENSYSFRGRKTLRMTDFNIRPPTALLGMLKTGNEVTVFFDVLLQPQPSSR